MYRDGRYRGSLASIFLRRTLCCRLMGLRQARDIPRYLLFLIFSVFGTRH